MEEGAVGPSTDSPNEGQGRIERVPMEEDAVGPSTYHTNEAQERRADTSKTMSSLPPPTMISPTINLDDYKEYKEIIIQMRIRTTAVVLLLVELFVAIFLFSLGMFAFLATSNLYVGVATWAGLILLITFVYEVIIIGVRIFRDHKMTKKKKILLELIKIVLKVVALIACIVAVIEDFFNGYNIHITDFSQCVYTSLSLENVACVNTSCYINIPPKTCYCCTIYSNTSCSAMRYSDVANCEILHAILRPVLFSVGGLGLFAIAIIAFSIQSSFVYVAAKQVKKAYGVKQAKDKKYILYNRVLENLLTLVDILYNRSSVQSLVKK